MCEPVQSNLYINYLHKLVKGLWMGVQNCASLILTYNNTMHVRDKNKDINWTEYFQLAILLTSRCLSCFFFLVAPSSYATPWLHDNEHCPCSGSHRPHFHLWPGLLTLTFKSTRLHVQQVKVRGHSDQQLRLEMDITDLANAVGNNTCIMLAINNTDENYDLKITSQITMDINTNVTKTLLELEQGLTSQQTHYRSYRGWDFTGQMTQQTVSRHWRKLGPKDQA